MATFNKNGILIETNVPDLSQDEIDKFYNVVFSYNKGQMDDIIKINVNKTDDDDKVDVSFDRVSNVKFERLSRVTGYLSKVSNWNDGKRAELADRVKHA